MKRSADVNLLNSIGWLGSSDHGRSDSAKMLRLKLDDEGNRFEGLVMGGCRDPKSLGQAGEKHTYSRRSHFQGMFLIVKEVEPSDPASVCFGGSGPQVAEGCRGANLVEEFGLRYCGFPTLIVSAAFPAHRR